MTNGYMAMEAIQDEFVEDLRDKPHPLMFMDRLSRRGHNTGTLLSPVLEGIQPKIGQLCSIIVSEHTKDTAGFSWSIVICHLSIIECLK